MRTARSSARGSSSAPRRTRSCAPWLVLATGAVPQALIAAGICERRTPSGIALRGYVRNEAMVGRITALDVVWHRTLRPRLRLDLSVPRRRLQHRRRHRAQPQHAAQRPARHEGREPARAVRRLHARLCAGARADGARQPLGDREGRAAALLARRRALVARRPAGHRRGRGQHLSRSPAKASARRWRPACSPPRRSPRGARRGATTRRCAHATKPRLRALKPRFDALRAGQSHQRPSMAGRSRRSGARAAAGGLMRRLSDVLEEAAAPARS